MVRVFKLLLAVLTVLPCAAQDLVVYDDALQNGFEDWSWAVHDLSNTDPVAEGSCSISWQPDGWAGIYLHRATAIDIQQYPQIRFWIHGGPTGGQQLRIYVELGGTLIGDLNLDPAPAGDWQQRTVDLGDLGLSSGTFDSIVFQDLSGGDQEAVFLDLIELLESGEPPPPPTPISITIQPSVDRHAVSPLVYGVNFGEAGQLVDPGFPVRRWGGNSTTRYNWRADVHNTASDWFFMNIPDAVADPGQLPDDSGADTFVAECLAASCKPILTVPLIGWAPIDERVKRWGFSVSDYGPQLETECSYFSEPPDWCQDDAGNGECDPAVNSTGFCSPDGLIVGNDPADTSQAIGPTWVSDWMAHLAGVFGSAASGGPRLWALDNEPMLWNSTHRDIAPTPLTYDEIWSRTVAYATAIKSQDPGAEILGPVVWGWCAFFSSASDAAFPNGSCTDGPDRQAHGGLPFLEWYLQRICEYRDNTGVQLVDYLDVHFYPQGDVSGLGGASSSEDPVTAARRLRSVRELWDPAYVSESWIGEPVYLIPRLKQWIDSRCPGIGIALTEYKWGPDDGPSGALAQAEVLAVLGREGVDLATRWVAPEAGTRSEDAFRLFLNYDGAGGRIEGDSVGATSDDVDAVAAYAVRGVDDILWVLLFNKDMSSRLAQVSVAGTLTDPSEAYRFDPALPLSAIGPVTLGGAGFELELPPRSATLVVTHLAEDALFADGFESGDALAWDTSVGGS